MKVKQIAVINGPNMNLLGEREPKIYGKKKWIEIEAELIQCAHSLSLGLIFYQSNHQGDLVDFIQEHMRSISGAVINPAAFSCYGYAILDALLALPIPYVEVHMTNLAERGDYHQTSIFTRNAAGFVMGIGGFGYECALRMLHHYLNEKLKLPMVHSGIDV